MKCPRCETTALEQIERDGVPIEFCQQCKGLWLDRGRLEKLIAGAAGEEDDFERRRGYDDDDDDNRYRKGSRVQDDDLRGQENRKYPDGRGRKRRWYESLTDMFD
jgi:Zn-finger nucleic acid-binding protein